MSVLNKLDINALQSLLPQAVIEFALDQDGLNPPLRQPFRTVALFADVSGFTKLSEAFASKGPQGAEELAFFLNRYMEQLVRHIARAGGDVFKFAGDAMLVLWVPSKNITDEIKIEQELHTMAHRAVQASLQIQDEMSEAELTQGVTLSVKIGIGIGNATVLHVGGVYSRVEYFACGLPLMQAFQSEDKANPGDVIVSPDVWNILKESFDGIETKNNFMKITKQTQSIRNRSVSSKTARSHIHDLHDFQKLLERYIPAAVLPYLTRCQKSWSGELRLVSVLFVNIGVNLSNVQDIDVTSLDWIQQVITGIQKGVYRYEGSLNKFLVDDKGSNVIAVFGVPPLAHYDDATRGVLSALKLLRKMRALGIRCCIGVTSGLVYTGLLGSGSSREYGVLGDAVNLSARLMAKQKYSNTPGVLCDSSTQELIPSDAPIRFDPLEPFYVKGKQEQIYAYSPKYSEQHIAHKPNPHYYDVGRERYLKKVEVKITQAEHNKTGYVILIESPIGTGKTYFLESIANLVARKIKDPSTLWAGGFHYVSGVHLVWSIVFATLLEKNDFTENRSYRQHVKTLFMESEPDLVSYLSLANDIFGTQFLESEKCSRLPDESRFDKKSECCLFVLKHFTYKHPICIYLDNAQWMQEDDWKITEFVCNMICTSKQLSNIYLFLCARPLLSPLFRPRFVEPPSEFRRIRKQLNERGQLMSLRRWDLFETKSFICEFFAVDDIQPYLATFIYERTGGNPAFCTWICELIECHITHANGVMLLSMSEKTHQCVTCEAPLQHPVPIKVHSTLMGYIDRLTPSQILLLKTAACVCMGQGSGSILFDEKTVIDCYPVEEYKDLIESDISHLSKIGIINPQKILSYDVNQQLPNIFSHNFQFMYQSTFLSAIMDVNSMIKNNDSIINNNIQLNNNILWQSRLCHYFMSRLIFFSFDIDKGSDWKTKKIIPFNDPLKPVRLRRITKEIIIIEFENEIFQIRGKERTIDQWYDTMDESLSRGLMTEKQEKELIYPLDENNPVYSFASGFFRDVIYGLMLLKQRQQLHDNCAKFLSRRWHNADFYNDETEEFSQYRTNILSRHRDLALKDDTIRRMGSFYQAAPQAKNNSKNSKRLVSVSSNVFKSGRTKSTAVHGGLRGTKMISPKRATLRAKDSNLSIFGKLRQSLAPTSLRE